RDGTRRSGSQPRHGRALVGRLHAGRPRLGRHDHRRKGVLLMVLSPRGIVALGLSLAGVAYLVSPSLGQAQQQSTDGGVRKAGNSNTAGRSPAGVPKPPVPPVLGTIDLDLVLKNYKKFEASSKEFQAAMLVRRGELQKIDSEARQVAEMMQKLTPGTEDYRKQENRLTELR